MKIYVPEYYDKFKCFADKCKHSCCIGWEIDIDDNTYRHYLSENGALSELMKKSISNEGGTPHFVLGNDERCPFLNENGLCDIITELGESALCEICMEHPRFRNYFSDRIEIGIGICCEAACDIVIDCKNKHSLIEFDVNTDDTNILSEDEKAFFQFRDSILDIVQNENNVLMNRFETLFKSIGITLREFDLKSLFDGLEYMENNISLLMPDKALDVSAVFKKYECEFEKLTVYFIFRHLADGISDGMFAERIVFAYISVLAIASAYLNCADIECDDVSKIKDFARIYSAEIEYSEENVADLLEKISGLCYNRGEI